MCNVTSKVIYFSLFYIFFYFFWVDNGIPGFNFALNLLVYGFYLRCLFLFWFCFDLLSIAMFICLDARESCIMLRIVLSRFVSRELCVVIFSVFGCHVWSGNSVLRQVFPLLCILFTIYHGYLLAYVWWPHGGSPWTFLCVILFKDAWFYI